MSGRRGELLGEHVVVLGWDRTATSAPPSYTITLPSALPLSLYLDKGAVLSFGLADAGERPGPVPQEHASPAPPSVGLDGASEACACDPNQGASPVDLTLELVASDGSR
jgi:hypothetical protein